MLLIVVAGIAGDWVWLDDCEEGRAFMREVCCV